MCSEDCERSVCGRTLSSPRSRTALLVFALLLEGYARTRLQKDGTYEDHWTNPAALRPHRKREFHAPGSPKAARRDPAALQSQEDDGKDSASGPGASAIAVSEIQNRPLPGKPGQTPMKSSVVRTRMESPGGCPGELIRHPGTRDLSLRPGFLFFLGVISRRLAARHQSCKQCWHSSQNS